MNDFSADLLAALLRTTLLLAAAALLVRLLLAASRTSSPTTHRVAWCLVLLQGWLILRLPVVIPYYEPPPPVEATEPVAAAQLPPVSPSVAWPDTSPVASPVASTSPFAPLGPSLDPDDPRTRSAGPVCPPASHFSPAADSPASANAWSWSPVLATVWLLGMGLLAGGSMLRYVCFTRRLPPGKPADPSWTQQWEDLLAAAGIRRKIPLRTTTRLGPLLCRLPRGYHLFIPARLWRQLTPAERLSVLRHELAHYQRGDAWKSLFVRLLALPHWFNPFAWWAVRKFDEAAQWACDRQATGTDPAPATGYVRVLLQLGEAPRGPAYGPAAHGHGLSVRVRRLLTPRPLEDSAMKKILVIALSSALVALCLVRFDLVAKEKDPAAESNPATAAPADEPEPAATAPTSALPSTNAAPPVGQPPSAEPPATAPTQSLPSTNAAPPTGQPSPEQSGYRALLKERLEVLRQRQKYLQAQYEVGRCDQSRLLQGANDVLQAELELCRASAERIALYQKMVENLKTLEELAATRLKAGIASASLTDLLDAKAARLEAESRLQQDRDGAKRSSLAAPGLGPAASQTAPSLDSLRSRSQPAPGTGLTTSPPTLGTPATPGSGLRSASPEPQAKPAPKYSLRYDGRTFSQWLEELRTELKPERRTEAIKAFAAFGANGFGTEATQAIVEVMRGFDVETSADSAANVLKQAALDAFTQQSSARSSDGIMQPIDPASAVPVLSEELKHGNRNGRLFAADVLPRLGPLANDALPSLMPLVADDKDPRVRQKAFLAVATIDQTGQETAAALRQIFDKAEPERIQWAMKRIVSFGVAPTGHAGILIVQQPGRYGASMAERAEPQARFRLLPKGKPVLKLLIETIGHQRPEARRAAIDGLGRIGPEAKDAVEPLLNAFHDGPSEDRSVIACTLAAIGPVKTVLPALTQAFEDHPDVRRRLVHLLGDRGPDVKEATPLLEKAAEAEDEQLRNAAEGILKSLNESPPKYGPAPFTPPRR